MSRMILLALVAVCAAIASAEVQTVKVEGKLLCGDRPTNGKETEVKLTNDRTGFDDTKKVKCNDDGTFNVELTIDRWFDFDPQIHIYTNCNDEVLGIQKLCQRKWVLEVPDKYVNGPVYQVGTYNMEAKQHDEETDCIH